MEVLESAATTTPPSNSTAIMEVYEECHDQIQKQKRKKKKRKKEKKKRGNRKDEK